MLKTHRTMPPKKVLIAVDWTKASESAFDWYVENLHRKGSMLLLIHFIEAGSEKELHKKEAEMLELQEKYETKLLKHQIEKHHWVTVSSKSSSPGEQILRVSRDRDVNMIVMGTRGLGKLKRAFLGSVSNYVVTRATVPVLVCKESMGHSDTDE